MVERTGFAPWISVFRYSLDTILECGSLLPLLPTPQVFLNRAGVILSESALLALRRGLRSEGSQLFVPRMESRLAGNWCWLELGIAVPNEKGRPRAALFPVSLEFLLRPSALLLFFGRLLRCRRSRRLRRGRRSLRRARDAVLEAADALAKSLHDFRDSLAAKENQYNGQNHKPMKNAKFTHEPPPRAPLGGALFQP